MKKTKTKFKMHIPSWRAIILITWLVFLTAAVALSILWQWDSMKIAGYNAAAEFPRLVRDGMEDTYRYPIVSAEEKVFVLPELNIALPYDNSFSGLRYSGHVDDEHQEATLTTSDIIAASIQTRGAADIPEIYEMPYFTCSRVLLITMQQSDDYGTLLDNFDLSDGRTVYAYVNRDEGVDCEAIYGDTNVDAFLNLVRKAQPYDL